MSAFTLPWIFRLDKNHSYSIRKHLPPDWNEGWAFYDSGGRRRLEIHPDGTAVVLATYTWDGCTPKIALFDIPFGIPDGIPNEKTRKPKAYYASLMHDVLYQFLEVQLPLTRKQVDTIFLELLEESDFAPRQIYYAAVRVFGDVFRRFTLWKRSYAGKRTPL